MPDNIIDNNDNVDASLNYNPLKENEQQYLWRIGKLINSGVYNSWQSVTNIINEQLFKDDVDSYKGESSYRKTVAAARKFFEAGVFDSEYNKNNDVNDSDTINTIKLLREEQDRLKAAKIELSDQRREYNKLIMKDARINNLSNVLIKCVEKMNMEVPIISINNPNQQYSEKEALLCLSDWHYGMVTDNIWNKYNVDICKERVNKVVEKTIEYIKLYKIKKLSVVFCGDLIHGSIHVSCRVASEENTVDELIHASEILAEVLNELSSHVEQLDYYSTYGNHARVQQLKDESVHEDNFERLIPFWLEARLQNNKKIHIHNSEYKEFVMINIFEYNICAIHGDLDNIKDAAVKINTLFNRKFGKSIDYIVSGDKHHLEEFESYDIESVIVRSLCGTDEYSNNKRLYSCPGQTIMIFNKDEGRECTRNIKLC